MASVRSHSVEALTDEKLERVFREIEEASERRAREEEDSFPSSLPLVTSISHSLNNIDSEKKRRRASISVSRVGNYADLGQGEQQSLQSGAASPVPWGPLYTAQSTTRTESSTSLSSGSSIDSILRHFEEENLTTQKETIVGRRNTLTKAVSNAFARTLTRMRSRGALDEVAHAEEVIIGVAVHEATTTAEHAETEPDPASAADNIENNGSDAPSNTELGLTSRASGSRSRSGTVPGLRPEAEVYTEVSALVSAEAALAADGGVSRSRSGSITKLRAKRATILGLRGASGQNGDSRQQEQEKKHKEKQRVPAPISVPKRSTQAQDQETVRSPPATSVKTPRIIDLARSIAQRLRRRPSGEENEAGGTGNESGGGGKVKKNKEGLKVLRRPKGIRRAHSASAAYQLDGQAVQNDQVGADVGNEIETTGSGTLPRTSSDPALPLIPLLPLLLPVSGHVQSEQTRLEALDPSNIPLPKSPSPSLSPPASFHKADNGNAAETGSAVSGARTQPNSPSLDPVIGLEAEDEELENEDAAPILSASVLAAAIDEVSNKEYTSPGTAENISIIAAPVTPTEDKEVEQPESVSVHEVKLVEEDKPFGSEEGEETS